MSNLNFPTNPTIGQTHTVGLKTYTWNGNAWIVSSSSFNATTGTAGTIYVTDSTSATSTTTGALTVVGGVGIGGDLYVGGNFYAGGQLVLTTASFEQTLSEGPDIDISPVTSGTFTFIVISNTSTLQTVTSRGNSTTNQIIILNTDESTSTQTGALIVSGGIGIWGNGHFEGRVYSESLKIADAVFDSTLINISSNATTVIDVYSLNDFRAAKYFIQISDGTGPTAEFQAQEITLIASNTGTVDISVYGTVTTNGPNGLGDFSAMVDGSDVKLLFTADFATSKSIRVLRTALSV